MTPSPVVESGRFPAKILTAPMTQMKDTSSTGAARTLRIQIIDQWILAQSPRSAMSGSTRVARRAGTAQATIATAISRAATAAKVTGSVGCTP